MKLKQKLLALTLCLSACLVLPMAHAEDAPAPEAPRVDAAAPEAPDDEGQAITLSTVGGTWLVQGEFTGRMSVGADKLLLRFDKARLLVRDGAPADTRRQVISITPCLGTATAESPFTIPREGTRVAVNREVSSGQPCEVEAFQAEIALDKTIDLSKHWLVLKIEMMRPLPNNGPSFVFINSDHGIFTPKP